MNRTLLCLGLCLGAAHAAEPAAKAAPSPYAVSRGILSVKEPMLGINAIPASKNRWRSYRIQPSDAAALKRHTVAEELDLFTLEYGAPLKPWSFAVPEKGTNFLWGAAFDDPDAVALRWGKGWGDRIGNHIRLEMDVASSVPTEWRFVLHGRKGKRMLRSFKVAAGASHVSEELALFRSSSFAVGESFTDGGVELVVRGAGAKVDVSSLLVAPATVPITMRRRFDLAARPERAGISFSYRCGYVLRVNGREIARGKRLSPGGPATHDITAALAAGPNEIAVTYDGDSGFDRSRWLAVEAFAVDRNGRVTFLPGDANWKAKVGDGAWKKVGVLGREGLFTMRSGLVVAEGSMPLHAGPLAVKPQDTPWPVFDADGRVAWEAWIPSGLSGAAVTAVASDAFTGKEAARATRTATGAVVFNGLKPGAYRIAWTLADAAGATLDTDETEMLVTGPLAFDEVAYAGYEKALRAKMRLLQEVDCTATPAKDTFLDQSGVFSGYAPDVGRVREEKGLRFRETGASTWDLFAYKVDVGELGEPHILEVDYPDTREQSLYVSVNESLSVPFCNNGLPEGSRSWCNATGCALSGGIMPLSGERKTMRVLFFPGSRNTTVLFENGRTGTRAGVCGFRVYRVEGTLPALKLPKTERLFANHNERPLFCGWGESVNPGIRDILREYRDGYWAASWKAIVNRLQQLKYAGHNASIEGAYMYFEGLKTESGESTSLHPEFDFMVPMLKMYRANGIRTLLGYEYTASPRLLGGGVRDTSDRDVAAGRDTVSLVDCRGRQVVNGLGCGGLDFLHPAVIGSMKNVLGEIYARYAPLGVEGVFVISDGCSWLPSYVPLYYGSSPDEVGFGDRAASLFERETGISLGIGATDPKRFAKRHALLTGTHRAAWNAWRAKKQCEAHEQLRSAVAGGAHPWTYFCAPCVTSDSSGANPFTDLASTPAQRAGYVDGLFDALGYTRALYPPGGALRLVPKLDYIRQHEIRGYGPITSESAHRRVADYDAVYLAPIGLDEHNQFRVNKAKDWWWRRYGVFVADAKPAGKNAYYDCVGVCAAHTPKTLVHTWLDVNQTTGDADESRRFLTGFYATPVGVWTPFAPVKGVTARVCGNAVQLVNDSPHALVGRLRLGVAAADALTGPLAAGEATYVLEPFGLTVLTLDDPAKNLSGAFAYAPGDAATVRAERDEVLQAKPLTRRIAPAALKRLEDAATDYDACRALRDWEVMSRLQDWRAAKSALANQARFEKMLAEEGVARVDCGKTSDTTDEEGRLWLPDQTYFGFAAYGNEHGGYYDRGTIPIAGTKIASVYRTETTTVKEPVVYRFTVPEGTYEVRVLYADCWNKAPGVWQTLAVGGETKRYDTVRDVGRCAAGVHVFRNVKPQGGRIDVTLANGIINGIEIRKSGKGL